MTWIARASDRRSVRRAVGTRCQAVTESEFELLGERVVDISAEGMLVESDREPAIGEEVIVAFRAPGTGQWLDAEATVARVVRGRRQGDRCRGVGLSFKPLDAVSRSILSESLRGHPPPVPGRGLRKDYARSIRHILRY